MTKEARRCDNLENTAGEERECLRQLKPNKGEEEVEEPLWKDKASTRHIPPID